MALRFGAHMPTAGGLHKALAGGAQIACDTVQLFTASPRQWASPEIAPETARKFRRMTEATGLYPLVAHDSYLINLAAKEETLRDKSRQAFLAEMNRAEALGLDYVVTHMGAHTGAGMETGIAHLADSLNWLHAQIPNHRVRVALETTAGQGTTIGGSFDHFPEIFQRVTQAERLTVCLDTCHIFVAGYDLRNEETARKTWDEFGAKVGFDKLVCIHANDAQKGLGSHTDRHAHIGTSQIGRDGFRAFLSDPRLPKGLPVIVETPDADDWHRINVWQLRQLCTP